MIPPPQMPKDQNTTQKPRMWEDTSSIESHYSLKPEPYSLESGEKDPELLGPQSTLKRTLEESAVGQPTPESESFLAREEPKSQGQSGSTGPSMTRSRCISLIGKAKYDEYTKRFGSEEAAIRKCIILERVQKSN